MKIQIAIPSRDMWKPDFGQSLSMNLSALPHIIDANEYAVRLDNKCGTSIIHQARNFLVMQGLRNECSHIMFLDDDMRFKMDTLGRLINHDLDIVAANCTTKELPAKATAIGLDDQVCWTRENSTGLEEVKSVGTAVMCIKMDVFLKLEMPWFDFGWQKEPAMFDFDAPVEGELDGNSLGCIGEDVYFCHKAREAGYKIFIDHDISKGVTHIGDWPYGHHLTPGYREEGLTEEDILRVGT